MKNIDIGIIIITVVFVFLLLVWVRMERMWPLKSDTHKRGSKLQTNCKINARLLQRISNR